MPQKTVGTRYWNTDIVVPHTTLSSAPLHTLLYVGDVTLGSCQIVIPNGHNGVTGIAIDYARQRIIPWERPGEFVVANDIELPFTIDIDISKPVDVYTYNEGQYDHTFHLFLVVTDFVMPTTANRYMTLPLGEISQS